MKQLQSIQPIMNAVGDVNVITTTINEDSLSFEAYRQHRKHMSVIYRDYGYFGYCDGTRSVWTLLGED